MPIDKNCRVCGKIFQSREIPNRGSGGARSMYLRPYDAVTCGRSCSRIYARNPTRYSEIKKQSQSEVQTNETS